MAAGAWSDDGRACAKPGPTRSTQNTTNPRRKRIRFIRIILSEVPPPTMEIGLLLLPIPLLVSAEGKKESTSRHFLDKPSILPLACYYTSTVMAHLLRIEPADPRPIWRQIEEAVRHHIASGALPAGALVPSVRDLARDLQVNPATVSKAYQRLTDAGVLAVRRGEGTFVAEAPPAMENERRSSRLQEEAVRYASLAITLGASQEEALDTLE